jgi:hypothetical protein
MSHLIEEYAKSLGCKIGRPYLCEHFYPVVSEKYITFHTNDKKVPSKHYDHWHIVFKLIKDHLVKEGVKIVQVGGPEDPHFPQCDEDTRKSSFKQMSHVIKNGMLHFGIDSLPMHIGSFYDKKMVCLFSNLYPANASPIWNIKSKYKTLSPDFSETKPSFSAQESPKRINEIKPEKIAIEMLDLLGISHQLSSYKTLNIGKHYSSKVIEVVPTLKLPDSFITNSVINVRCDYGMTSEGLNSCLSHKVNLMIEDPIDPNFIKHYRKNIVGMTIFMDKGEATSHYLDLLKKTGVKFSLICKSKEKISGIRFKFFDWTIEEHKQNTKNNFAPADQVSNKTLYHSNKTLIEGNKLYSSKASWKNGLEKTEENGEQLIDCEDFWEEVGHFHIYNI